MSLHDFTLAWRLMRRHPVLSALIVLALALGIGASMTTLTVYRVLSGDPLPGRSDRLFAVQLDAVSREAPTPGNEPNDQLTRFDAEALLRDKRGLRQAMMSGGQLQVRALAGDKPLIATARYTTRDFFAMFGAPLRSGQAWSEADEQQRARVVVISDDLARKLYGEADPVGRNLLLRGQVLRIVGVLAPWRPVPHFYDLNNGRYAPVEQVFVPWPTAIDLRLGHSGRMWCWGDVPQGDTRALNAPCAWIQYWVELPSAAEAPAFRDYLTRYSADQRAAGRYERPPNVRLRDVMAWLTHQKVVPADARLQLWLSAGFLGVCVLNTVGLLLAMCLRRAAEIGVRRALGATRRAIFTQYLALAAALGGLGGVLGLGLAALGLWAVRQGPESHADLARLDGGMLAITVGVSLLASLLAGALPAWRACQITPALQLKAG